MEASLTGAKGGHGRLERGKQATFSGFLVDLAPGLGNGQVVGDKECAKFTVDASSQLAVMGCPL